MSGMSPDQLHRSTLGIYESLLEQFNPGLQRLVALGNAYIQAFQALAATSEDYFNALGRMGEQALHTISSHSLGDVIVQIAQNQRKLSGELEGMFRWFHSEVLLEMENNVKLDKDFITGSRRHYEMEVRNQASALERHLRRGGNQDGSQYTYFLHESHKDALKEEERRYRFLAEKHCNLSLEIAHLMNKTGGALQQRAEGWRDHVNETRAPRQQNPVEHTMMMGMREEDRGQQRREEESLGRVPSRGPSPQPTTRSRSGSLGEGLGAGRLMRALTTQPASSNPTLLDFSQGDTVLVLVPEPRNGWLYGRSGSSSRQGWFPASYVEPLDQRPPPPPSLPTLRNSHSMSNLLDQSGGGGKGGVPPPAPPLPSTANQMRQSSSSVEKRSEKQQKSKNEDFMPRPELFPRGTNPFATVKLKPTVTNDKSAPKIF